jgi:hypothetical protein
MLIKIAQMLDTWIFEQNLEAQAEGRPLLQGCRIRVLGQMALLENKVSLPLTLTNDVDVYADYEYAVESEFRRLLAKQGKDLDPMGREIWMPRETEYRVLYKGQYVTLQVADVESVLISKALKAPKKNHALIVEYLAQGAGDRFFKMARKYRLDLEQFL